MKITIELDMEEAENVRRTLFLAGLEAVSGQIEVAIDNENERLVELDYDRRMESGGTDDTQYRDSMKDAGRGHLIR